jgi:hypothetical protein
MFCRSLFVLLYFFLLAIVLSVILRYTDSDYPFGIFKLFLHSLAFLSDVLLMRSTHRTNITSVVSRQDVIYAFMEI